MRAHLRRLIFAVLVAICLMLPVRALSQVKPGDRIVAANAAQVKELVSPGTYIAVTKGMQMDIVAPGRIDLPPPYFDATEKYSAQVRLAPDHRSLMGYVAGAPFPLVDPNDADVATKIMWNTQFRPITTDDFDLRFFECHVDTFNPGGPASDLLFSRSDTWPATRISAAPKSSRCPPIPISARAASGGARPGTR